MFYQKIGKIIIFVFLLGFPRTMNSRVLKRAKIQKYLISSLFWIALLTNLLGISFIYPPDIQQTWVHGLCATHPAPDIYFFLADVQISSSGKACMLWLTDKSNYFRMCRFESSFLPTEFVSETLTFINYVNHSFIKFQYQHSFILKIVFDLLAEK